METTPTKLKETMGSKKKSSSENSGVTKRTQRQKPQKAGKLPFSVEVLSAFEDLINSYSEETNHVAIFVHDTPDPDALSSAFGLAYLLKQWGFNCEIFYDGYISHPQNKAMMNSFEFSLKKIEHFQEEEYNLKAIVDTSNTGKKNLRNVNFTPDIIIDHHNDLPDPESPIILKAKVGSTATLITLLLDYYDIFSDEVEPTPEEIEVATALMIGLKTDTKDFTMNVSDYDKEAFPILIKRQDNQKVRNITNYPIPEDLFKAKSFAFYNGNYHRNGSMVVAGTGFIKEEHKDFNAIIADELIRGEGIEKVIVIGIIDYKAIVASVRTTQITTDTKEFCHRVFGEDVSGGKKGEGGAYIELSEDYKELLFLADDDSKQAIWDTILKKYIDKVENEHTKS